MGNRQACFFVGHRNIPESIRPDLSVRGIPLCRWSCTYAGAGEVVLSGAAAFSLSVSII